MFLVATKKPRVRIETRAAFRFTTLLPPVYKTAIDIVGVSNVM